MIRIYREADSWVLHTPGNFSHAYAFVNGMSLGQVNPLNPYLDLTPYVEAGETPSPKFNLKGALA